MEQIYANALGITPTQAQVDAWVNTKLSIDQVFVDFALGDQFTAKAQPFIENYLTDAALGSPYTGNLFEDGLHPKVPSTDVVGIANETT